MLNHPGASSERSSPAMGDVLRVIARVASQEVPVIFQGEPGSGKKSLARVLHADSARRARPFVTIDCAVHDDDSERARRHWLQEVHARIASAEGGTVLLEEVACVPEHLQIALGHVVDRRRASSGGSGVRFVATTRRDIDAAVHAGILRKELLFRLDVIEIHVPALRERREDIEPLARGFLDRFARTLGIPPPTLTLAAQQALLRYSWPGNLREMRSAMERGVLMARGGVLDLDALPSRLSGSGGE
jgi:DNA-binding NtrC family response regulator